MSAGNYSSLDPRSTLRWRFIIAVRFFLLTALQATLGEVLVFGAALLHEWLGFMGYIQKLEFIPGSISPESEIVMMGTELNLLLAPFFGAMWSRLLQRKLDQRRSRVGHCRYCGGRHWQKDQQRCWTCGAMQTGFCAACGYNLRMLESDKCPECGTPMKAQADDA